MDGSIRVSAKTVDDAITEAMIQLGVTSDRLEYEVIEKGSAGFLGIGMKQAVIEARRKKGAEKENDILEEIKKEVKMEEKKSFKSDFKKEVKKEIKKDTKKSQKELVNEIKDTAVKEESEKDVVTEKTEAGEKKKEKNAATETSAEKENSSSRKSSEVVEVTEETKKAVEKFLSDVFQVMGMEVQIKSEIDKDGVLCIDMSGDNMGIIIGKRGQTLDSLQYLSNRVANKQQAGYVRVKLDTENYRVRREETLRHLAKNIAHKVKRNRKPIALEPMNPYERRIIHYSLQSDPYVTTHSEGEDPYRKVVVTLKR
ncbi:RNA-binding cell elongation regulator Jag/EloR [Lachnospiraceae bacterium 29-91]